MARLSAELTGPRARAASVPVSSRSVTEIPSQVITETKALKPGLAR